MVYLIVALVAVISYLIGSINSSIMLSRAISGEDIRKSGSGNAGATNMLRTHGKKMGVVTLLIDVLKGVVAVLLATAISKWLSVWVQGQSFSAISIASDVTFLPYIAAVCVVLGHNFPIFFGFKGGKGVATGLGVIMILDWKVGLCLLIVALLIMAITRYVSLGSVLAGAAYIIIEGVKMIVTDSFDVIKFVCVAIIGGLLIIRHRANIKRLLNGTENKLSFGKKEA